MNTLAGILNDRMRKMSQYENTDNLDLGTITIKMGLKIDNFKEIIPKGDYLVCKSLKLGTITTTKGDDSVRMPGLKPGSRVLVGWISGEPVVIDIVVSG